MTDCQFHDYTCPFCGIRLPYFVFHRYHDCAAKRLSVRANAELQLELNLRRDRISEPPLESEDTRKVYAVRYEEPY